MNWLAHLFLSAPDMDFRLGNLLADFVRGAERERMSPRFREGVQCHLGIDAFTDAHPRVRRSKARLTARFRRFAGVLVDVYYDHLLARHWERFCEMPLREFTHGFSRDALPQASSLPEDAEWILHRIIEEDRLWSYHDVSGVEVALWRLSQRLNERWNRGIHLQDAIPEMQACDAELEEDFLSFFPELVADVGLADVCARPAALSTE